MSRSTMASLYGTDRASRSNNRSRPRRGWPPAILVVQDVRPEGEGVQSLIALTLGSTILPVHFSSSDMCHGRLCRHPRLCSNRGMGSAMRVALPFPPTPTYAVRWGESTAPPSQTFNPMLLPRTERAVDHALDRMGIPRRRRRSSQRLRMVEEAGWHPWIADASAADVALLPIGKEGQIGERRPALASGGSKKTM